MGVHFFGADNFEAFSSVSVVPIPAAFPLLAGGLGLIGLFGWRRKRRTA